MPCPKKTTSTWSFCPYCGVELPPNEKQRRGRIRGKGKNRAMTISPKIMPLCYRRYRRPHRRARLA